MWLLKSLPGRRFESPNRRIPRCWQVLLMMWLAIAFGNEAHGGTIDYVYKARMLCNLAEFTDWPSGTFGDTNYSFTIGVLGKDPFGHDLENFVHDRKAVARPIVIQHYHHAADAKDCQILYISASESKHLPEILAEVKGHSILTVSDMKEFASRGGMVSLSAESDQIQFRINLDVLKAAGLSMSSKLLRTAEIVVTTQK